MIAKPLVKIHLRVAETVAYFLAAVPNGTIGYIEQKRNIAIAETKDTKNYHLLILGSEQRMFSSQMLKQSSIQRIKVLSQLLPVFFLL